MLQSGQKKLHEKKEGLLGLAWLGLSRAGSLLGSAWDGVSEIFEKGTNWLQGEGFVTNKEIAVKAALQEFHRMGIEEAKAAALQEYGIQKGKEILDSFYTDSKEKTDAKIWALKQAGYDTTAIEMEVAKRRQALEEKKKQKQAQQEAKTAQRVEVKEAGLTGIVNSLLRFIGYGKKEKVIVEGVKYFSQRDNETRDGKVNGHNMCNLTSLAMVMESKGIDVGNGNKQYEDRLYEIAKEMNMGGEKLWERTSEVYKRIIKYVNEKNNNNYVIEIKDKKSDLINFEQKVKNLLDNDNPVIVSGDFPMRHIVTIVGYDKEGWIVHDPYGNANTKYRDTNGKYVHYKYGMYDIGKKWFAYIK